ncbi:choline transporter-like protein 5-like protein [Corchorus olitorius]|uniref:Choline transporter-like protein 5-like protein n=1 Tax=Corchorus olitorius TaxID=93759 RepID=A0A1R3K992_9ROSI|nr:choline transporter-like protein 5-like protein [Corchorus olitorius]
MVPTAGPNPRVTAAGPDPMVPAAGPGPIKPSTASATVEQKARARRATCNYGWNAKDEVINADKDEATAIFNLGKVLPTHSDESDE